jgi:hypothetical protein
VEQLDAPIAIQENLNTRNVERADMEDGEAEGTGGFQ